jgi:hypothetical protein
MASMRFARNSTNRTEAPSAQCRSSTTSSCGRPAASAATSQYRPWSTPKDRSASPGGTAPSGNTIGAASAAAPANVRSRAPPDMPRSLGSSNCRITPQAYARSNSDPRAPAMAKLRACAASRAETRRLVFPIPAGPSTTTTRPAPAATSSSAVEITPRSRSRSWSSPIIPGGECMAETAMPASRKRSSSGLPRPQKTYEPSPEGYRRRSASRRRAWASATGSSTSPTMRIPWPSRRAWRVGFRRRALRWSGALGSRAGCRPGASRRRALRG